MQVDARRDGALLLELYSRDGIGTMIRWGARTSNKSACLAMHTAAGGSIRLGHGRSRDFYEGMRPADPADVAAIAELLAPLEAEGVLAPRSRAQLEADLPHFVVAEREAKVCVMLSDLQDSMLDVHRQVEKRTSVRGRRSWAAR